MSNATFQVSGAGLWIDPITMTLTFKVHEITDTTGTDVRQGSTILTTRTAVFTDSGTGLSFYDVMFPAVTLNSAHLYHINASFPELADANQHFQFDAPRRDDASVNLGAVTLIDGTGGFDPYNSVTPYIRLFTSVPEPTSAILLSLGVLGLAGLRRRR